MKIRERKRGNWRSDKRYQFTTIDISMRFSYNITYEFITNMTMFNWLKNGP